MIIQNTSLKLMLFAQIVALIFLSSSSLVLAVSGQDLDAVYEDKVWLPGGICEDSSNTIVSSSAASFERSKLDLYESQNGQADPGVAWAKSSEGKNYAIDTLKIPEADMKQIDKNEVIAMMKAEIAVQFAQLPDKFDSTLQQAQQAILSYQEHEDSRFQLFDENGVPSYTSNVTLNILSLTMDKFTNMGKNKRAAASYDIKYAIYLGVKEHMAAFSNNATGIGEDRWKSTIGYVFLPSDPDRYWTDSRSDVAIKAWEQYANLSADVIDQCNCLPGTGADAPAAGFPSETTEYYKASIEPKVKELQTLYQKASEMYDFPWELIAALHYRETSFSMTNPEDPNRPGTSQGVWQLFSLTRSGEVSFTPGAIDDEEFLRQTGMMIEFFRGKQSSNSSENRTPPVSNTNRNAEIIKDTLWGYNGRINLAENDPENLYDKGYDTAAYVMNMYDDYRMNLMKDVADEGTVLAPDQNPGVYTIYSLITQNSGVICNVAGLGISADGFVFPVKAPKQEVSWCGGRPPENGNCHGVAWAGTYYAYDLMTKAGNPVVAAKSGQVYGVSTSKKECTAEGQTSIWIEGDDGFWYFYQHMSGNVSVSKGQHVEAGQQIGVVGKYAYPGDPGNCSNTPPHLHFAASSAKTSMYRGCTQSSCPNMDKLIDISEVLKEAYNAIP